MARLYSQMLFRGEAGSGGVTGSDVVPDGYIWVVRDLVVYTSSVSPLGLNGWTLEDGAGYPIDRIIWPRWLANTAHHRELRQVMETGDQLIMLTGDDGTWWRVSGYVLSAP